MAEALLELDGVSAGYGEGTVLDRVSLTLPAQGSLALLGRNGVGKTTLLLTIMGYLTPTQGSIRLDGRDITRLPPHRRAQAGLGWVPQERAIFPSLTVEENLTVAAREGRWHLDAIYRFFPRLKERRGNMGSQLSGGEQQMLTIGRTLMTNPSVLLLDEPLEGLAPIIVEEILATIRRMAEEDIAFILVEQHAETVLGMTDRAAILERGVVAHQGPSAALLEDPALLNRFVGLDLARS